MISDDGKFISLAIGAELAHACKLAEGGHSVIYYYYGSRRVVLDEIMELCGAYPIGLRLEAM